MSIPHPEAVRLNNKAFQAGIKMSEAIKRANVSRSTWWRIKTGKDFRASSITNIEAAIDDMVRERGA